MSNNEYIEAIHSAFKNIRCIGCGKEACDIQGEMRYVLDIPLCRQCEAIDGILLCRDLELINHADIKDEFFTIYDKQTCHICGLEKEVGLSICTFCFDTIYEKEELLKNTNWLRHARKLIKLI